jgi:Putative prokaryotic signal transducing protein
MSDRAVRVYASGDSFAGELMKGRLETEGIPVMIKGEAEGPYRMGPVYLWVPEAYETQAKAVIDAVQSGAFALEEDAEPEAELIEGSVDPSV